MQRNLLNRCRNNPNLSFRTTNEGIYLKHLPTFEKAPLRVPASLKQLRLHSGTVVVYLDLHSTLRTSPFLSKLVADLKECCFSHHDGVDILLDHFSPNLLHLVKSLLETGGCPINSEPEKDKLELLLDALGMESILSQLYAEISPHVHSVQEDSDSLTPEIAGNKRKLADIQTECQPLAVNVQLEQGISDCTVRRCYVKMNRDNQLSDKSNLRRYTKSAGAHGWGRKDSGIMDEQNDDLCIIESSDDQHSNTQLPGSPAHNKPSHSSQLMRSGLTIPPSTANSLSTKRAHCGATRTRGSSRNNNGSGDIHGTTTSQNNNPVINELSQHGTAPVGPSATNSSSVSSEAGGKSMSAVSNGSGDMNGRAKDGATVSQNKFSDNNRSGEIKGHTRDNETARERTRSKSLHECLKCGKKFEVNGKGISLEDFSNHVVECEVEILKDSY